MLLVDLDSQASATKVLGVEKPSKAITSAALPTGPSYTSIATQTDGIVTPEAARLEGGQNIVLQEICPLRPTMHGSMLIDSLAYALFRDARAHDGPADPSRVQVDCATQTIPMNTATLPEDLATLSTTFLVISATYPHVPAEPELFCYADGESARGVGTYCPPFGRTGPVG